jgi:hypothetical protein
MSGQDDLRKLLRAFGGNQGSRDKIILLLNPRKAAVVELAEEDFRDRYDVTTEDNYATPFGMWDRTAVFDAAHGYYVLAQVRPLRRE